MGNNFHIAWCPFCNQGWVNVVKDSGNNKILLSCDECDTTWLAPSDIALDNPTNYNFVGKLEMPSLEEVQQIGWDKLLVNKDEIR